MDSVEVAYAGSEQAIRKSLDLYSLPLSDVSCVSEHYLPCWPISQYKDDNLLPIEFEIPRSPNFYLALSESYIYAKCRILKANGDKLTATDKGVAPGQQFACQMFDTVNVYLNGVGVTHTPSHYQYRAAVEQLLSTSPDYQNSFLGQGLFYRDSASDKFTIADNTGYHKRLELTKQSKEFEVITKLYENIFESNRMLSPGVSVRVRITRSSPLQCLVGEKVETETPCPYKIMFDEIVLYAKLYVVNPSLVKFQDGLLSKNRMQYPVINKSVKAFTIPKSSSNFSETIYVGSVSQKIAFVMTDAKSAAGTLEKDMLNFQNFSVGSVTLSLDGESRHYNQLKFDSKNYLMAYKMMLDRLKNPESGHSIERTKFADSCFILAYQLSPSGMNGFNPQINSSQLKLELTFNSPLTSAIQLLAIGSFQSLIQVDKQMQIYTENSVI
jgi:hypothetical protein